MKKYLWFLITLLVVVGLYSFLRLKPEKKVLGTESHENVAFVPEYGNTLNFSYDGKNVDSAWYKVNDPFNLALIANFDQKENAKDVFDNKSCKFLTNAGFYTTDNKPIGLFVSEGVTSRNFVASRLADGILSINYIGTPRITRDVPRDPLRIAVQTGPIIKENLQYQRLSITDDKEARRMVAGITGENELYFMVFYDKSSAYTGPLLADLPAVLKAFEEKSGFTFGDAVNLDGGTASAFYTNGFSLSELSPIGAFFCEK